jgi:hypothetical protein
VYEFLAGTSTPSAYGIVSATGTDRVEMGYVFSKWKTTADPTIFTVPAGCTPEASDKPIARALLARPLSLAFASRDRALAAVASAAVSTK